jgi:hypothetical protein
MTCLMPLRVEWTLQVVASVHQARSPAIVRAAAASPKNAISDRAPRGSASNIIGEARPRCATVALRILPRILPASSQRVIFDSLL